MTGGGALYQPLLGWLLDLAWTGEMVGGARAYAPAAYSTAFSVLIAGAVPMAISVAIEGIGMWDPGNGVRGMTGAIAGVALAGLLVRAAATVDYERA